MNDSINNNINNNEPTEVELGYNKFFYLFPLLGLILISSGIIASVWNLITTFKTDSFLDNMVVLLVLCQS
ncbi:MAG: hypothetical protein IJS56_05150 [Bacilli bacterium]|nr:hypothetical protein [Bacilli bacterium]